MSIETFSWKHDSKPTGSTKFAVRSAQFGDGYRQTAPDGINNKSSSWPLSFSGYDDRVMPIRDFLDARQGSESFYWTPPLGAQGLYKCAGYDLHQVGGDVWQLTATFEESFQP